MTIQTRTLAELGKILRLAIESSEQKNIPAVAASADVKPDTIRRWVRGENEPGALDLGRVALTVNYSLDSLVYDTELRPAALSSPREWSFSEKQMATLIESFRALDQLNRLMGDRMDVVATYCDAPKTTLAAILARSHPPIIPTDKKAKSSSKDTKMSENRPKRKG